MSRYLGIDPGPDKSGWCVWDSDEKRVLESGITENALVLDPRPVVDHAAIEWLRMYAGVQTGQTVLQTCRWVGRFQELLCWDDYEDMLITRPEVAKHFTGLARSKKPAVNKAIQERFGGKGTKKEPGPFYGVKSHAWDAAAIAIMAADLVEGPQDDD